MSFLDSFNKKKDLIKEKKNQIIEKRQQKELEDLKGLNQSLLQNDAILDDYSHSYNRILRFKQTTDKTISISAGSLILSMGVVSAFGALAITAATSTIANLYNYIYESQDGLQGIFSLLTLIFVMVFENPDYAISGLAIGFFVGGFLSAMFYKKEGRLGPLYSARLAFSITISLTFVAAIITLAGGGEVYNGYVAPVVQLILFQLIIAAGVVSVLSIPSILISWIGYRFGLYLTSV